MRVNVAIISDSLRSKIVCLECASFMHSARALFKNSDDTTKLVWQSPIGKQAVPH